MKLALLLLSSVFLCSFGESYSSKDFYLSMNIEGGKELILDDDSKWEISPDDWQISRAWISSFPLSITYSDDEEYPFILTNSFSKTQVKAKAISHDSE